MAKELPYFRWYPKDAESDSKYSSMTLAELGLFHRCLNHSWLNDGIPSELSELSRELRISEREIKRHWPRVSRCFVTSANDARGRNLRQEEERSYALTKSERSTNAVRARYERNADVGTNEPPRAYESESGSISDLPVTTEKTEKRAEAKKWFEDEFWPLWPVKHNKAAASVAALQVTIIDRPLAVVGVKEQSDRIRAMERPIHASTWLRGRRWEDEPALLFTPPPDRNQQRREETRALAQMMRGVPSEPADRM